MGRGKGEPVCVTHGKRGGRASVSEDTHRWEEGRESQCEDKHTEKRGGRASVRTNTLRRGEGEPV